MRSANAKVRIPATQSVYRVELRKKFVYEMPSGEFPRMVKVHLVYVQTNESKKRTWLIGVSGGCQRELRRPCRKCEA